MADNDPSATSKSSGAMLFLFAAIGLALLAGAVALGWKLSRPRLDLQPITTPAAPTPPAAPPEKSSVTNEERQEVLKRIDLMPNVSAENKERLYAYVEHAQKLQRLLTVTFETGRTKLSEKESARVVRESKLAAFAGTARDPVTVFVVLGYADPRGDEKKNLQISNTRATSVMDVLRKQCGVQNVIHPVPMGNPRLFNPNDPAENRVAEIWAVQP